MQKKYLIASFALISAVYFFSCSSGNKLRFYQPSKQNLVGIRKLVIAPYDKDAHTELLGRALENALKQSNYFLVFDKKKFGSVLEQYSLTFDSLTQADSTSKIGKLLNVDGVVFSTVKKLEILPTEKGVDRIEKMVWTGEYERDATGEIIEEVSAEGKSVKKKKFKLQPVDQSYQIRKAEIGAEFKLADLKKGGLIFSKEMTEKYTSGKIIPEEGQALPTDEAVKRKLIVQINQRFINEIAPQTLEVKRVVESGPTMIDSGAVFAKKGEWKKAADMWDQAKKMYPANASVYYNLGLASEAQGDFESAEIYYRKAALLNSKSKLYQKAIENIRAMWQEQDK